MRGMVILQPDAGAKSKQIQAWGFPAAMPFYGFRGAPEVWPRALRGHKYCIGWVLWKISIQGRLIFEKNENLRILFLARFTTHFTVIRLEKQLWCFVWIISPLLSYGSVWPSSMGGGRSKDEDSEGVVFKDLMGSLPILRGAGRLRICEKT
jgi:hypothetical protein